MPYYLGKRQQLELFDINVVDHSKEIARALRDHGLSITAAQLRKRVDDAVISVVNEIAYAAQDYARKWVPKDTTELMGDIKVGNAQNYPGRTVYIADVDHYGSRRRQPENAPSLGEYLDEHSLERSRGGGSTNDWIVDAQLDFQANAQALVSRAVKRYF